MIYWSILFLLMYLMKYLILQHWVCFLTRQSLQAKNSAIPSKARSCSCSLHLFDTKVFIRPTSQPGSYQASLCSSSRAEGCRSTQHNVENPAASSKLSWESYRPSGIRSLTRDYLQWCTFNSLYDPTFSVLLQFSRFQGAKQKSPVLWYLPCLLLHLAPWDNVVGNGK